MSTDRVPLNAGQFADQRVYLAAGRVGLHAAGFLAGGVAFLLVLLARFVLLLASKSGASHHVMPGLLGGLSVIGIGLIARGVMLLRSVVRVTLDGRGITLDGLISSRSIAWEQIDRIERDKRTPLLGGKSYQMLKLLDARGATLASIPDTIAEFHLMANDIAARSAAARGRATFDPAYNEQGRLARESRRLRWSAVGLVFFAILMAVAFAFGVNEELHLRRYATEGVRTDAKVVRRYMVRVTPWIEYSFTDAQGHVHDRKTTIQQEVWDALADEGHVPVEYLRSDPNWSRLIAGEEEANQFGGNFLYLTGGGTILFGALAAMALLGFDVKSEGGQMRITRRGRVIRRFGRPTLEPMEVPSAPLPPPSLPLGSREASSPPLVPLSSYAPRPVATGTVAPAAPMPMRSLRPAGIVALGVLSLIFGTLGLLVGGVRVILFSLGKVTLPDGRSIFFDVPPWLKLWTTADALLAFGLLVAGIGLLWMRRWARNLGMGIAALQLLSSLGGITSILLSFNRITQQSGPNSMPALAGGIGAVIVQILGMIFPLVLLIILARRNTAEAMETFAANASGPTSAFPPPWRT